MGHNSSVARSLLRIARLMLSGKEKPSTAFEAAFWDVREKLRAVKDELSGRARAGLESRLVGDLRGRGYEVLGCEVKLGKFRGSYFVTSCPLQVRGEAKGLEGYLVQTYSPKFRLKSFEGGISVFNVR